MLTDNQVFIKVRVTYFFVQALAFTKSLLLVLYKHWCSQKAFSSFCTSIGVHKKPSPRFAQALAFTKSLLLVYQLVYFDGRDQFNPSIGSSDTRSDNCGQTNSYLCVLRCS